ncbi:helix-turn-helix domain-containing protein [Enterococcus innesii]|uniref:helix-turn-helix domain-containing protein n=1 Tax=Enterococcus innesii TaxID=2839759 RepID=UPI0020903470|nr:AsnC family protein [Enterococcus innesii]MCO5497138.1 AsnC family protein [Enterococcus innesii]
MNKNQQYQNTILRILVDSPQITVKKIAEKIGLSEKTTRLQLDYLNEYLNQNSIGCIERIPGKGVKLTLEKTING